MGLIVSSANRIEHSREGIIASKVGPSDLDEERPEVVSEDDAGRKIGAFGGTVKEHATIAGDMVSIYSNPDTDRSRLFRAYLLCLI